MVEKVYSRRTVLVRGLGMAAGGLAVGGIGGAVIASALEGPRAPAALGGTGVDAADAGQGVAAEVPAPTTFQELFARVNEMADGLGGVWEHPEPGSIQLPKRAPYLPKTEKQILAYGKANGWNNAVFNRVIMLPSNHPLDHVKDWKKTIFDFGQKRGWGDITAWDGTWVYPMMLTAGQKDIAADKQVKVMSDGKMVGIDPVRVDNWTVSANVVGRGDPKMAVYMVPWVAGEVHARLPQDTEQSEVTMAFALNNHFVDNKTEGNDDVVPAIIVRGVATAPVSILYGRPTDNHGGYETRVVETRLEPLTGNVTIHLPKEGVIGDHAPFIAIRMPVVANNPKGETEVIFVPGSDVLPTNPKYAEKHRITEDMLRAGTLVR